MRLSDIPEYWGKNILIELSDGSSIEGLYGGFENWADSDDERESVYIDFGQYLEQIYVDDIKSVSVV